MTSAINSASLAATASTSTDASTGKTTANPTLGKDDFLKLLVAQLSHQDPTQPMEGTEFVTQLSQFSLVEQSVAQSTKLDTINSQLSSLGNAQTTSLLGKNITSQSSGIKFDGLLATQSSVTVGGAAAQITATITDASGQAVRTINAGARGAGVSQITWDGKTDAGGSAPAGTYTMKVAAVDAAGNTVPTSQSLSGTVTGVSYSGGQSLLTLDNGAQVPVSNLVSVASPPATTK